MRGREDLVEGWREDLDRYHKSERAALDNAHSDRARQIERRMSGAGHEGARWGMGAGARPEYHPHADRALPGRCLPATVLARILPDC